MIADGLAQVLVLDAVARFGNGNVEAVRIVKVDEVEDELRIVAVGRCRASAQTVTITITSAPD